MTVALRSQLQNPCCEGARTLFHRLSVLPSSSVVTGIMNHAIKAVHEMGYDLAKSYMNSCPPPQHLRSVREGCPLLHPSR